ncbi:MAG: hypothetical protein ABSB88_03955 [Bryobacteraceae bacterium]|jgi:hypothetical protein
MLRVLWRLTRGYRLRPWKSPYLRWRIETYSGLDARSIGFWSFWRFGWQERRNLLRYLRWAARMSARWGRLQPAKDPLESAPPDGAGSRSLDP